MPEEVDIMESVKPRRVDELSLKGRVSIWQGEGEDKEVKVDRAKNKWVDAGLKGLLSAFLCNYTKVIGYAWSYSSKSYLGQDTTTTTAHNMTALVDPIGAAPGTAPNSTSGEDISNPATGQWHTAFISIWNAGTVSGTVGEVALYLRPYDILMAGWTRRDTGLTFSEAMVSRCSVADGDFSQFSIDSSKSLTVYWEVMISYE